MNLSYPSCWCGNRELEQFSREYLRCPACETLILAELPIAAELLVVDDDTAFYGKNYFKRMAERHGLPALEDRARFDLQERCLYWLRSLLRYRQPPARILELGSGHGAFVALMRWAGFDATGLDLSPGLVERARCRFDVPILEGPIEAQDLPEGSLDAIVLMDVLEHLGDPEATLRHCFRLLKSDGLFFLQTPQYRERKSLAQMQQEDDPFLRMLLPDQHLYLFSKSSVQLLLRRLGIEHVGFEPAIFSGYDMSLVAGRSVPEPLPESAIVSSLQSAPSGRLVLALRDLDDRFQELSICYAESEADRAARLRNLHAMEELYAKQGAAYALQLDAREAETVRLLANIEELREQSAVSSRQDDTHQAEISGLSHRLEDLQARIEERDARIATLDADLRNLRAVSNSFNDRQARESAVLATLCQELRDQVDQQTAAFQSQESLLARLRLSYIFRLVRAFHLWGWLAPNSNKQAHSMRHTAGIRGLQKIAIDLTPVLPGGENGGAKVMTLELIRNLGKLAPEKEFILLTSSASHDELACLDAANVRRLCVHQPGPDLRAADSLALRIRSFLMRFVPEKVLARIGKAYRKAVDLAPVSSSLLRQLQADLLFCPFTAPFFSDAAVPTVSVVYDLQHIYYPQFFDLLHIEERERNFRKAVRVSSRIVCISNYVRDTVLANTKMDPERLKTIHILLPCRLATPNQDQRLSVLKKWRLTSEQYLLYPANFWFHKNHEMLLTAFAMFRSKRPDSKLKLVLTGSMGARGEYIRRSAEQMGISAHVLLTDYVREDELGVLMHSCAALIFPSLFEGFGMPLLEAMAARKPLLCANSTSLPEVAGDAALFFDPRKPVEIAAVIARFENEPQLRLDLAAKSAKRLSDFGGAEEMAAEYLQVFADAAHQPNLPAPGVYGGFSDGWLAQHCSISIGPGDSMRKLRLVLSLPAWVPVDAIPVRVAGRGAADQVLEVARGGRASVERDLGASADLIELSCAASFQPSTCGQGEDSRFLSCFLHTAEIIEARGGTQALQRREY